jgi:hypothetical protein
VKLPFGAGFVRLIQSCDRSSGAQFCSCLQEASMLSQTIRSMSCPADKTDAIK